MVIEIDKGVYRGRKIEIHIWSEGRYRERDLARER